MLLGAANRTSSGIASVLEVAPNAQYKETLLCSTACTRRDLAMRCANRFETAVTSQHATLPGTSGPQRIIFSAFVTSLQTLFRLALGTPKMMDARHNRIKPSSPCSREGAARAIVCQSYCICCLLFE